MKRLTKCIHTKTIYNACQRLRLLEKGGRSQMQQLNSKLSEQDVATDGHCGFSAITSLLEYNENGWVQVRTDLLELET